VVVGWFLYPVLYFLVEYLCECSMLSRPGFPILVFTDVYCSDPNTVVP
jgi:hypothetical protein